MDTIIKVIEILFPSKLRNDLSKWSNKKYTFLKPIFKDFIFKKIGYVTFNKKDVFDKMMRLPQLAYTEKNLKSKLSVQLKQRDKLLNQKEYKEFMNKVSFWNRRYLIKNLVDEDIGSYNKADKVIGRLILLFPYLRKKDFRYFFEKNKNNNQIAGTGKLKLFIDEIKDINPSLLTDEMKEFSS